VTKKRADTQKELSPLVTAATAAAGMAAGLTAGWIAYSHLAVDHEEPLPGAVPAGRAELYTEEAGRVSYYVDRSVEGRPLVLVHSINAAASAYEMRPLFRHYQARRPVYAIDLPGYGFSERSARAYDPELFTDALLGLLQTEVDDPADVVALSLSCEYAARATLRAPDCVRSLTFISPTGFGREHAGGSPGVHAALAFPLWARPLFDLLTTRPSIEFYLKKSFEGAVPPGIADYAYATAHQPGAHHAPLYFLSGLLFTPRVMAEVYDQLEVPTLVLYDEDPYVTFEKLPRFLAQNKNWQAERVPGTRGLPHFERLPETIAALQGFWG
jgi:pimeloyl-ACP methyl ester carboxylesterase